jgi:hypothetical protein
MSMNTTSSPRSARLRAGVPLLSLLALAAMALGSNGCATENKVLKTSRYTLTYPDFWKVEKVGEKDGEATRVTIGKYSTGTINEGSGAINSLEASQADVDVRVYTWTAPAEIKEPSKKAGDLMTADPDLNLAKQVMVAEGSRECGTDFKAKMHLLNSDQYALDLFSRPGHRLIVVGAVNSGVLVGVVARVPYEQDAGLYCHNLQNMRLQMQNLMDGIALTPAAAAAPPAGAAPEAAPPPPPPPPAK